MIAEQAQTVEKGHLPMPVRIYSYIRFSAKPQERGDSIRRQEAFRERVLREENGVLDDTFTLKDYGVSAHRSKNALVGSLSGFMDAIKSGRIAPGSILAIECLDRLSRDKIKRALSLFLEILGAGIVIRTAFPDRRYSEDSINDTVSILEVIIYMVRAHDESATKSIRVREAWGEKKLKAASDLLPHTAMAPAWLQLIDGSYQLIPERVAIVQAIYRMAREGLGSVRIVRMLNASPELYPPFGALRGKPRGRSIPRWNSEYVDRILNHRAVMGDHQRYSIDPETGKKVPDGDPIRGFYPQVICEDEFYATRAAIQARLHRSGRPSRGELNILRGLVINALDAQPMGLRSVTPSSRGTPRRRYSYLTSSEHKRGKPLGEDGGFSRSIDYHAIQHAVRGIIMELKPEDVMEGKSQRKAAREIQQLMDQIVALGQKEDMLRQKVRDPRTPLAAAAGYTELIDQIAQDREAAQKRLRILQADSPSARPEALGELQGFVRLLEAEGEEGEQLRRRVAARLRQVIEDIWVLVECVGYNRRAAHVQVNLRGGERRYVKVFSPQPAPHGPLPATLDLEDVDLREFKASSMTS